MSSESFDFKKFVSDSQNVLVKPKEYFEGMSLTGGLGAPIIKVVLYGVIAGVLKFIWSLLSLGSVSGMLGGAVGIGAFIGSILFAVIGLFIGAVITLIISAIAKGNTDFEACIRVQASLMILIPIQALLSIFSGLNLQLAMVINLIVFVYGLWMFYHALVGSLKASKKTSQIIVYALIILIALIMLAGYGAGRKANQYMKSFDKNLDKETKEMLKDFGLN